jgi:hypothetical protein
MKVGCFRLIAWELFTVDGSQFTVDCIAQDFTPWKPRQNAVNRDLTTVNGIKMCFVSVVKL